VVLTSDFYFHYSVTHILALYVKQFLEIKLFTFDNHENIKSVQCSFCARVVLYVFLSLFCSPSLHSFDQKYTKKVI